MAMTIVGAGSAAGAGAGDPAKMASHIASRMMRDLDSNKDGSLDKSEFVQGLTSKGVSATDAEKTFDAIDTQKTGSISKADIEAAVKSGVVKPPPGGRAPAGAGGPPPGCGAASKSYDAADTNKDGTVSAQEALVYSIKNPSDTDNSTTDLAKLGNNVDESV